MILFAFTLDRPRDTFVCAPSLSCAVRFLRMCGYSHARWTGEAIHE